MTHRGSNHLEGSRCESAPVSRRQKFELCLPVRVHRAKSLGLLFDRPDSAFAAFRGRDRERQLLVVLQDRHPHRSLARVASANAVELLVPKRRNPRSVDRVVTTRTSFGPHFAHKSVWHSFRRCRKSRRQSPSRNAAVRVHRTHTHVAHELHRTRSPRPLAARLWLQLPVLASRPGGYVER